MRVNLFDIDNKGAAKITKPIKEIWYLKAILDKYGEEKALKLFQIFDKCYNLNPNENPFANLTEDTKFETVLRSTYPELEYEIDMEDDLIQQALDLVGELYETNKYRAYKAIKIAYEKIIKQLQATFERPIIAILVHTQPILVSVFRNQLRLRNKQMGKLLPVFPQSRMKLLFCRLLYLRLVLNKRKQIG